jgi:hypothetical protein
MSCWYDLYGTLSVTADPEVAAIVAKYNDEVHACDMSAFVEETDNAGIRTVTFEGGGLMSASTPTRLDEIATQLSPYVVEPGFLYYTYEGEKGQFYVGPDDQRARIVSADTRAKIQGMYGLLLPEDAAQLVAALTPLCDPEPVATPSRQVPERFADYMDMYDEYVKWRVETVEYNATNNTTYYAEILKLVRIEASTLSVAELAARHARYISGVADTP